MFWFNKKIPWYKKKKIIIPLSLFIFLLVVRAAMVPIIQNRLNHYLATFSPTLYLHMDDLDLHIIRGAYTFEGITGRVKTQKNNFLTIERVDVSLMWRELFRGKIVTNIEVTELNFSYTGELLKALDKAPEKDPKVAKEKAVDAKDTLFPLKVERVDLVRSTVTLDDYPSLEEGKKFQISDIEGRLTNLKPEKDFPLSYFNLRATILGNSVVKAAGHLNTLKKPLEWDVDSELQGFDLTKANVFLRRKLPITFTKGKLDVYAEAESVKGKMEGYVKPFLKDLDIMKIDEPYKGVKHWFIEAVSALGNLALRTADTHTVATKVIFKKDDNGFQIESGKAISKAIEHGFVQKLSPGIEDKYELQE